MLQKACDSSRRSLSSSAIASDMGMGCLTAAGLHETRTKPASVTGQVAQPNGRVSANQACTAS